MLGLIIELGASCELINKPRQTMRKRIYKKKKCENVLKAQTLFAPKTLRWPILRAIPSIKSHQCENPSNCKNKMATSSRVSHNPSYIATRVSWQGIQNNYRIIAIHELDFKTPIILRAWCFPFLLSNAQPIFLLLRSYSTATVLLWEASWYWTISRR